MTKILVNIYKHVPRRCAIVHLKQAIREGDVFFLKQSTGSSFWNKMESDNQVDLIRKLSELYILYGILIENGRPAHSFHLQYFR